VEQEMERNTRNGSMPGTLDRRQFMLGSAAAAAMFNASAASAAQPLRLGISLIDIPRLWGSPDGGFEGMRFGGYTIYDALVTWDLSQGDGPCALVPGLATSWKHDDVDKTRLIVTLREGVKFHDGSAFDADAAVWNFDSIFNEKSPQFSATRAGVTRSRVPTVARAEKIDDKTIAVITTMPDASVIYQLSLLLFVSPTQYAKLGNDWAKFSLNPSGTGAFKFTGLVPRTRLDLARNADYWDAKRIPKSELVQLVPIPDANARVAALRSGQIDFMESVPPDTIPSLKAAGLQVVSNIYPHTWNWAFSHLPDSPYRDVRVRQAANLAIDRQGIVALLNGTAAPAKGMVPQNSPWFGKPGFEPRFDLAEAKRLMTAAGYGPNNRAKTKTLIANSGGGQMVPLLMNDFIQANLAEIWIDVEFQVVDFITLFTAYRNGATAPSAKGVHAINLASPVQDPGTPFLRGFAREMTGRGANWGAYINPEVDALIDAARGAFDPAVFDGTVTKLQELLVKEAVTLMVVHDTNPRAMSPKVKGFVAPQNWFADFAPVAVS
jgi:peptide/nickel transport system substrate-binding protein